MPLNKNLCHFGWCTENERNSSSVWDAEDNPLITSKSLRKYSSTNRLDPDHLSNKEKEQGKTNKQKSYPFWKFTSLYLVYLITVFLYKDARKTSSSLKCWAGRMMIKQTANINLWTHLSIFPHPFGKIAHQASWLMRRWV